jgi:alkylhydroperoxidase family enzyme
MEGKLLNHLSAMTTEQYVQQTRLVARETQTKVAILWKQATAWSSFWKSRIGNAISRFAGKATLSSSRAVRSLLLARRFYPSVSPIASQESPAPIAASSEMFDPLVVRSVPRRLHALIRLRVAIRLGAAQAAAHSAVTCAQEGWSAEQVSATAAGYSETAFDEPQRLVLRFADDLTRTPMDVDLPTLRQLHRHFSNDQVIELAAAITQENYRTRFRTALELVPARAAEQASQAPSPS